MKDAFRTLFHAVLLCGAVSILEPYARLSFYAAQLAAQRAPLCLPVPVGGVRSAALRDSWHAPRSGGRRHEGIDIFAARGTPVLSSTEGLIAGIGSSRRGGRVVWVLGPGGQRHYYAHLARFADIHRGQRIEAGTLLGFVGNSGNARGGPPHLHYGVYSAGGAVNPFPLLRAGEGSQRPAGENAATFSGRSASRHCEAALT